MVEAEVDRMYEGTISEFTGEFAIACEPGFTLDPEIEFFLGWLPELWLWACNCRCGSRYGCLPLEDALPELVIIDFDWGRDEEDFFPETIL